MPSVQRGTVARERKSGRWGTRWSDERGIRKYRGGFATKTEARRWLDSKVEEVAALRRGDLTPIGSRPQTVDHLLDLFLEKHGRTIDPATKRNLTTQLRKARSEFGDRHPDSLLRVEVEDWRVLLPAGSRHGVFRAFRQALTWGVDRGLVDRNASTGIKNPKRKRHERRDVQPFETWEEVEAIAAELPTHYRALPLIAVGCGLRPEELLGLHRADVDRQARVLHVRRRYTGRQLKEGGKTPGSVRAVPLRQRVLDTLDTLTPRVDTPVLFPAVRGGYIDLEKFRYRAWTPALKAAGVEHRRIYDCRHTFATWALEGGVQPAYLAKVMGTSIRELEDTYFRWMSRTDERLLAVLDAYDCQLSAKTSANSG